jgi:hypothetical protein
MSIVPYDIPVLFLIFNRPDLTARVWEEITLLKPAYLYVAADGPRNEAEKNICMQTRKITESIAWDCSVKRLYRDSNLGCKNAVSSAIMWFYSEVKKGIVLEDDCLPDESFFMFCREMLIHYENDHSIGHISGSNHLEKDYYSGNSSHFFSKYAHIWGWASWARVWKNYTPQISLEEFGSLSFSSITEKVYWWDKFFRVSKGEIDTWDYQYLYMLWNRNLKSIMPKQNMVLNIGIDSRATHGSIFNYRIQRYIKRKREKTEAIIYPENQEIDVKADKLLFARIFKRFPLINLYLLLKYIKYNLSKPAHIKMNTN